ncbi:MAG: hypothetical protein WC707_06775 [Candidatus Babeliaceae bacterium]|jgi:hypothetical protein
MTKKPIDRTNQTIASLAIIYKMDIRTFRENINSIKEQIKEVTGRKNTHLTPKQVDMILEKLGEP